MKKVWIGGAVMLMIKVTFAAQAELRGEAVFPSPRKEVYTLSPLEAVLRKIETTNLYQEWEEIVENSRRIENPHEKYVFISQRAKELAQKAGTIKDQLQELLAAGFSDIDTTETETHLKEHLFRAREALKKEVQTCKSLLALEDKVAEAHKALAQCIKRAKYFERLYRSIAQVQDQIDTYKLQAKDYIEAVRLLMGFYASIFDFQEWVFTEISIVADSFSKIPPEVIARAAALLKGQEEDGIGTVLKSLSELFPQLEEINSVGDESENLEDEIKDFKEKYGEGGDMQ
jgi:uncharacterized coiled-coil DUF342 family protein